MSIHEAKRQLERLIDLAASGEVVVIESGGKPIAQLTGISVQSSRLGFLKGEVAVPDDFNSMGATEIATLLGGSER